MKTRQSSSYSRAHRTAALGACVFFLSAFVSSAFGAPTDISNVPLASNNPAQAKPNIMLLMDTSASMGWTHMPDSVEGPSDNLFTSPGVKQVGYKSYQCNVLYYNPNTIYDLPKNADGTFWTAPSFNAASYDAYDSAAPTYDLATQFKAYDDTTLRAGKNGPGTTEFNDTAQAAYYYLYTGTQTLTAGQAPCTDPDSLTGAGTIAATGAGGGTWTRKIVSSSSGPSGTNELQNFANWYSFYRTRMSLTKSAASLAFNPLTDSFRVGFISVQPKAKAATSVEAAKYLPLADFGATQRTDWYAKLFSQKPGGTSPAREGLARVGRHYAGMTDSINQGMPEDPVQYSCQQNFTILTTDGYWNDQDESTGGGPLKIDGTTLVGQQDGTLTGADGWTPRPIWEGFADGTLISTDKTNSFSFVACPTGWYNKSTVQYLKSTVQNRQTTDRMLQSTTQTLLSTTQNLRSTSQLTASTSQLTRSTSQLNKSTLQNLRSTSQLTRSTSQLQRSTTQLTQSTLQNLQSTSQKQRTITQLQKRTSQVTQSTIQRIKNTSQINQSTSQATQSTSQVTQSTIQRMKSTSQVSRSTSQITQSTSQILKSTSQIRWYNPATESVEPVASCPGGGSCSTVTTGPTAVASCSAASASSGNSYTTTTCNTVNAGPTAVASCSAESASSGNSYTAKTCNTVTTGPTLVATCTAASASSGNAYTTTTCNTVTTGPTAVASCTAASASSGNSYTATTCSQNTTGPTGVASCSAVAPTAGNSYTEKTCNSIVTGPTGVASCSAAAASSSNSYTATTCNTVTTGPTPVASCSAATASSSNSYTTKTCNTVTTGPTFVASCTAATASSGNSYTATTCTQNATGPTGVASCSAVAPSSGNSYTETTCATVNTGPIGVASCSAVSASAGNSYTATTCATVALETSKPVSTCTAAAASSSNSYKTTTCFTATTGPTPVATCTAASASSGNSYTAKTCSQVTTGPTPVASCTPVTASSANSYTATTCNTVTTAPVGVATCTPAAASSANGYTAVVCNTVTTGPTGVASCTPATASSSNSYTTTTCNTLTSGPTPVASCTAATASSGNLYVATTCTSNTTGPTPVATCSAVSASSGNNYVQTSCNTLTTGPTGVASCAPESASSSNSYIAATCNTLTTGPTGVGSCSPSSASSGNAYKNTTCDTITAGPTPVASCTNAAASSGNSYVATTCTQNNSGPTAVAACAPITASSSNAYTATICTPNNSGPTAVDTCAPQTALAGNSWVGITCTPDTVTAPIGSCTPQVASAGNGWKTISCPAPVVTTNVPSSSCVDTAAASGNNWTTTTCQTITTPVELVNTCTAGSSGAPNYINATCVSVDGDKAQYQTTTTVTTSQTSGGTVIPGLTPVVATSTDAPAELNGICYLAGTPAGAPPALPSPNPQHAGLDISPWPTVGPMPSGGCTAWPCSVSQTNVGGSINSLADVAQYYYVTDLRPASVWAANIATNNVPAVGAAPEDDKATHQHMTTFTVALGVSGTLAYDDQYKKSSTGDFADIRTGVKNWPLWPDPSKATWDSSANTYTAKSSWEDPRSIDDFWHTAVNGRGQYFSAGDPKAVVNGLNGALSGIESSLAAGSAAGTSSQEPVAGDNFVYVASYITLKWVGDVEAREIANDGSVGLTPLWSARSKLQSLVGSDCDSRNIYLIRAGEPNNLVNFTWNTKACDAGGLPTGAANTGLNSAEQAHFNASTNVGLLSQYLAMTDGSGGSVDQRTAAKGANLVNYLRGQRGKENFESGDINKLYRGRDAALGDIVSSQPVYVKMPFAEYFDPGYETFKIDQKDRPATIYVGANDGMLHAFNANAYSGVDVNGNQILDINSGKELWAVIPSSVIGNLYKLSDNNYKNTHTYFVDATPVVGDVDVAAPIIPAVASDRATWTPDWRSILVGGLNLGGKAYFALDVTDPASPKALWEFKIGACGSAGEDCHLGYTFGRPVITKLLDGRWVVILTSGYNNVRSPAGSGDGLGYVYVLKAATGELLYKLATTAGDASTPSGLAQINNYVSNARFDNSTKRVYGTDVSGNVWMFDVNDSVSPSGREANLLGTTKTAAGEVQSITVRPELAELGGKAWVFVGTGRLLGASDLDPALATTTRTQSVYGFIDFLTHPDSDDPLIAPVDNLHSVLRPLAITYDSGSNRVSTAGSCVADASAPKRCNVDDNYGWVLDLPDSGERVNVGMKVLGSTLAFASNVVESSACSIGGYGFVNFVDSSNGASVNPEASTLVSVKMNGLIPGLTTTWPKPTDPTSGAITGLGTPKLIVTTSDGKRTTIDVKMAPARAQGRRVSWRPLISP